MCLRQKPNFLYFDRFQSHHFSCQHFTKPSNIHQISSNFTSASPGGWWKSWESTRTDPPHEHLPLHRTCMDQMSYVIWLIGPGVYQICGMVECWCLMSCVHVLTYCLFRDFPLLLESGHQPNRYIITFVEFETCWKISCVESSHLNIKDNHGSLILGQKRFEGKLYSWRLAYFNRISPSDVFVSWKIGQHPKADFVSKIPCELNHATVSDLLNLVFAFGPNIPTLHHFFLSAMDLRIVSAKQHTCSWAFVLPEILIKDLR